MKYFWIRELKNFGFFHVIFVYVPTIQFIQLLSPEIVWMASMVYVNSGLKNNVIDQKANRALERNAHK